MKSTGTMGATIVHSPECHGDYLVDTALLSVSWQPRGAFPFFKLPRKVRDMVYEYIKPEYRSLINHEVRQYWYQGLMLNVDMFYVWYNACVGVSPFCSTPS